MLPEKNVALNMITGKKLQLEFIIVTYFILILMFETKGKIPNDFKNHGSLSDFLCKYLLQRKKIWNQCKLSLGQIELIFLKQVLFKERSVIMY